MNSNDLSKRLRFLILDPARGWQKFPSQHVMAMLNGAYRVPEFAGDSTRFVSAYLNEAESGRLTLHRLECTELSFDPNGFLDQVKQQADMAQRIESADQPGEPLPASDDPSLLPLTPDQISVICDLLGADR